MAACSASARRRLDRHCRPAHSEIVPIGVDAPPVTQQQQQQQRLPDVTLSQPSSDDCADAPPGSAARVDCKSVQITIGRSVWLGCSTRCSRAVLSATIPALKLEHRLPAGALSSWHSPYGFSMAIPASPLRIPPSAEPPDHKCLSSQPTVSSRSAHGQPTVRGVATDF